MFFFFLNHRYSTSSSTHFSTTPHLFSFTKNIYRKHFMVFPTHVSLFWWVSHDKMSDVCLFFFRFPWVRCRFPSLTYVGTFAGFFAGGGGGGGGGGGASDKCEPVEGKRAVSVPRFSFRRPYVQSAVWYRWEGKRFSVLRTEISILPTFTSVPLKMANLYLILALSWWLNTALGAQMSLS